MSGGLHGLLAGIPLTLRMFFYAAFFLCAVLVGLPWLAYRLDAACPAWHVEIGWLRLAGVAIFALFFGLYVYCSHVLTRRGRGAYVEFDPPREFVATGPYRWVRNPIAGCLLLMLLGEAIAFSSTGVLLLFVVALPLAHLQVVLLEEPLLRRRFGPAYEEYCRRVPRWVPRRPWVARASGSSSELPVASSESAIAARASRGRVGARAATARNSQLATPPGKTLLPPPAPPKEAP